MFRRTVLGLMLVLLAVAPWHGQGPRAEDETIRALRDSPVSQLEFGMFRLEASLQATQWAEVPQLTHGSVSVRATASPVPPHGATGIAIAFDLGSEFYNERLCRRIFDVVRERGGVEDGKVLPAFRERYGASYYAGFFLSPYGSGARDPKRRRAGIDGLISILVTMNGGTCRGRLLSTEIRFSED